MSRSSRRAQTCRIQTVSVAVRYVTSFTSTARRSQTTNLLQTVGHSTIRSVETGSTGKWRRLDPEVQPPAMCTATELRHGRRGAVLQPVDQPRRLGPSGRRHFGRAVPVATSSSWLCRQCPTTSTTNGRLIISTDRSWTWSATHCGEAPERDVRRWSLERADKLVSQPPWRTMRPSPVHDCDWHRRHIVIVATISDICRCASLTL